MMTQENKKLSLCEQLVELSTEHYSQDQHNRLISLINSYLTPKMIDQARRGRTELSFDRKAIADMINYMYPKTIKLPADRQYLDNLVDDAIVDLDSEQKDHARFNFFERENHYTISWHCVKD